MAWEPVAIRFVCRTCGANQGVKPEYFNFFPPLTCCGVEMTRNEPCAHPRQSVVAGDHVWPEHRQCLDCHRRLYWRD